MMRRRQPTPPPDQLDLFTHQAKVNQLLQETDHDPDYDRLKRIFAELSQEYQNAASPTPPSI